MKLPKEVTIGGYTFKVKVVANVKGDGDENLDGFVDFKKGILYLSNTLGKGTIQVFLHEIVHIIDRIYNADNLKDDAEVERISQGIYNFARSIGWIRGE